MNISDFFSGSNTGSSSSRSYSFQRTMFCLTNAASLIIILESQIAKQSAYSLLPALNLMTCSIQHLLPDPAQITSIDFFDIFFSVSAFEQKVNKIRIHGN